LDQYPVVKKINLVAIYFSLADDPTISHGASSPRATKQERIDGTPDHCSGIAVHGCHEHRCLRPDSRRARATPSDTNSDTANATDYSVWTVWDGQYVHANDEYDA
jgi:hypothetical protein